MSKAIKELKNDLDLMKMKLKHAEEELLRNVTASNAETVTQLKNNLEILEQEYKTSLEEQKLEERLAKAAEKAEEKKELTQAQKWEQFNLAREAQARWNFGFLRNEGEFFASRVSIATDKRDPSIKKSVKELTCYSFEKIGKSFKELAHPLARAFLRDMVEGETITIRGEGGELDTWTGPNRTYYRLVNTLDIPDPEDYNVLDLSGIVRPNNIEYECPWLHSCLFSALGNGKKENIEWLEKYVYSVAVADIGNSQTTCPVFYGKGKAGKNALFELVIPAILGKEMVFAATIDTITGNFNGFKLGKVLMFIDEVPPRNEWSKIKNLTGSTQDLIKIKYGSEYLVDNVTAIAFGSNELTFPLPWEDGSQMQRISPLRITGETFAEYVVKTGTQIYGEGFIEEALKDAIGTVPLSNHDKGDKFLRAHGSLWHGKDVIQQLVNYLHTKYYPGEGKHFTLLPLRGEDWDELVLEKKDLAIKAADWLIEREEEYIVFNELYEVYNHMAKDAGKEFKREKKTVGILITPYLENLGWVKTLRTKILHNSFSDNKKPYEEGVVFFKPGAIISNKVNSRMDNYFAEVTSPLGATRILRAHSTDNEAEDFENFENVNLTAKDLMLRLKTRR